MYTIYLKKLTKSNEINYRRNLPDLMENSEVLRIAEAHGKTAAQILLRWILQRGIATIPKSTNPQRLKQNIDVFDFELTQSEMEALAKLDSGVRVCNFEFFKGFVLRYHF